MRDDVLVEHTHLPGVSIAGDRDELSADLCAKRRELFARRKLVAKRTNVAVQRTNVARNDNPPRNDATSRATS